MRAWTVDADDSRVAEDFDEALLHRTPEIDSFLSLERDDKFIVIGTKGFGKTLLLKAKRILHQRKTKALCLPTSNLLDEPIGDKVLGKEALAFLAASSLPWSKLWLTAIAVATLKQLEQTDGLKVNPRLARLLGDGALRGVIDHFVRLLDFSPSDLHRAANDTWHLVPRLRAISTPVAIFIDGVDEYFNKHIETVPSRASVAGELAPEIWHFAQLGLVEVAYQLRRINHHLKVFAAIRKRGVRAAADHRHGAAVPGQRGRHRVPGGEPARDLRQQHPAGEGGPDGAARAAEGRSDRASLLSGLAEVLQGNPAERHLIAMATSEIHDLRSNLSNANGACCIHSAWLWR